MSAPTRITSTTSRGSVSPVTGASEDESDTLFSLRTRRRAATKAAAKSRSGAALPHAPVGGGIAERAPTCSRTASRAAASLALPDADVHRTPFCVSSFMTCSWTCALQLALFVGGGRSFEGSARFALLSPSLSAPTPFLLAVGAGAGGLCLGAGNSDGVVGLSFCVRCCQRPATIEFVGPVHCSSSSETSCEHCILMCARRAPRGACGPLTAPF